MWSFGCLAGFPHPVCRHRRALQADGGELAPAVERLRNLLRLVYLDVEQERDHEAGRHLDVGSRQGLRNANLTLNPPLITPE